MVAQAEFGVLVRTETLWLTIRRPRLNRIIIIAPFDRLV